MSIDSIGQAIEEWTRILTSAKVFTDEQTLEHYGSSTSSSSKIPAAILKPVNQNHVLEIVRIARQFKIPLYPISTGKNWGYGDACAVFEKQVIVDLSLMKRIVHVDAQLGYAVVEPGVTQADLANYLKEHGLPFWIDCSGAGPQSSMIGNIIERGFGHTPNGNRFSTVSGMEIVLGTGKLLRTGFGHYENSRVTHLYPYGIGPYLDGLFTQSNFGIVTQLGIWLLPIPPRTLLFMVLFPEEKVLYRSLSKLQSLRIHHLLQSICHIGNDFRAFSNMLTFPWSEVSADSARLPADVRKELRRSSGVGEWSMTGAFYGSAKEIQMRVNALRSTLRGTGCQILIFPDWLLRWVKVAKQFLGLFSFFALLVKKLEIVEAAGHLHTGVPTEYFMRGSYWRKRGGVPTEFSEKTDLSQDKIGLMWIAPIIPFMSSEFQRAAVAIDEIFAEYRFDCHITANLITERALAAVFSIDYDAENPAETQRARECYVKSVKKLFELGYPIYRASIAGMDIVMDKNDPYWQTISSLKKALDPDGIISPGRYDLGV